MEREPSFALIPKTGAANVNTGKRECSTESERLPVSCRFLFDPDSGAASSFASRLKIPAARTPLEIEVAIRRGWVCFDPDGLRGPHTEDGLRDFCAIALEFAAALPGRSLIVIDEAWRHISPRKLPDELLEVVKNGRKAGLQSVWLSQEPRELNETILAEATEIVCFRLDGLNSLGRLADYNFPRQDELPGLAKGQFVAWNKQSGGVTVGKLF